MRKPLAPLLLLCALVSFSASPRADAVLPVSVSCSYSSTEDCAGFALVTETCTTTYSNGTTSTRERTSPSGSECLWCFLLSEPCER